MTAKKARIAAYRCPSCGTGVMSAVDVSALTAGLSGKSGKGGRIRLRCSDPECPSLTLEERPAMDVEGLSGADGAGKLRFTVPCIFCGHTHSYTVDAATAASRESFVMSCPSSGIDICFIGETDYVKAELARSELEILDMIGDDGDLADVAGFSVDTSKMLPEPEIAETISLTVRFLEDEGKIICKCENPEAYKSEDDEDRIGIEPGPRYMRVFCRGCGAAAIIPAVSQTSVNDFAGSDSLVLEKAD
ncbi:MAG: hypothetical protein MJ137_02720 [Clostridia bacterium]|nr:hypothetical protein [Clostridia bacterium]